MSTGSYLFHEIELMLSCYGTKGHLKTVLGFDVDRPYTQPASFLQPFAQNTIPKVIREKSSLVKGTIAENLAQLKYIKRDIIDSMLMEELLSETFRHFNR